MYYAEYHDNGGLGEATIVFGTKEHGEALFYLPPGSVHPRSSVPKKLTATQILAADVCN